MKPLEHNGKQYSNPNDWRAARAGGGKPPEAEGDGQEPEQGGYEPHHELIHEGLRMAHEATGKPHSHVEHHGGGKSTSHHINHEGQIEGPHEHGTPEEMAEKMKEYDGGAGGEEPEGMEPEE